MSLLICSLSNTPTDEPVVSPVSGRIFDRKLLLKYLEHSGEDPIAKLPLSPDMLIDVKADLTSTPKLPTYTSIPVLLQALQKEWDAVTLHSFTLRQQLQSARQELSHSLYQQDAACRVIARLTKEVSAAREALATLKPQASMNISTIYQQSNSTNDLSMHVESEIPADVVAKLEDTAAKLTQQRKLRGKKLPEHLCSPDSLRDYICVESHIGFHSASTPGILSMDICAFNENRFLTGGKDKVANVFDKELERSIAVFKGHSKKITRVVYHFREDFAITASADSSVKIWQVDNNQLSSTLRPHSNVVSGLSLHPTGDYILTTSFDEYWAFSDLQTGSILCRVTDQASDQQPLTCGQFHPDGLIFGVGTADSMIKIWDLKERSNVANFPGHTGQMTALAFSENGYYLASAAEDAVIKIWDLRKLKNLKSIVLDENYEIKDIAFDNSGAYLGIAGSDVRIYQVKQWDLLCSFNDHTATATGIRFGPLARFISSSSLDRSLKIYNAKS